MHGPLLRISTEQAIGSLILLSGAWYSETSSSPQAGTAGAGGGRWRQVHPPVGRRLQWRCTKDVVQ